MNRLVSLIVYSSALLVSAGAPIAVAEEEARKSPILIAEPDSESISKVSLPLTKTIHRADLYFWNPDSGIKKPQKILILAPGRNGNGRNLITQPKWIAFAKRNQLTLCGLSFASNGRFDETGYSNANSGSGEMLKRGIEAYLGEESAKTPILIYGMSAGARFTASFVESNPERILAWCGQAVGKWENAKKSDFNPPGIVATGEYDAGCYHASILYFQQGRKLDKPWIWLSLEDLGHQRSPVLDEFVLDFFQEILTQKSQSEFVNNGNFYDIDTKKKLSEKEVTEYPIFSTWLPSGDLQKKWLQIHHP